MTPEIQSKIAQFRAKAADGTLTIEEMREAVELVRAGRKAAASSPATQRRAKAKAEIPSADDMLNELGGL